jgi:hypothetical protein
MAMTLSGTTSALGFASAQDDLYWIANSNYSGTTDFKYVFDIYVNGNQKIRSKVYPNPTTKKGYFDAGPIVRNEIMFDWFTPINDGSSLNPPCLVSTPGLNGEIGTTYDIRLGYELSGVTYLNQVSGSAYACNWAAPLLRRKQVPTTLWDNKLRKFMSNRNRVIDYNFSSKLLIPFWNYNTSYANYYFLKVRYNNSTGSWYYVPNCQISPISSAASWWQLDIGVEALSLTLFEDYLPNSFDSYDAIEVGIFSQSGSTGDGTLLDSVLLKRSCNPNYTPINLYFMNIYGMFDTACFNLVSKLSLDTERKSYTKLNKSFGNTSVDYFTSVNSGFSTMATDVYKESKINYSSKTNWTYKLTMDYPSDENYEWLSELILSPQIYAEIDGDCYPVTIKNTNYEYNQARVNGLKPLEIEIELNQTRYSFTR